MEVEVHDRILPSWPRMWETRHGDYGKPAVSEIGRQLRQSVKLILGPAYTIARPDELARRICHLAMEGERDPVRLHDRGAWGVTAIAMVVTVVGYWVWLLV